MADDDRGTSRRYGRGMAGGPRPRTPFNAPSANDYPLKPMPPPGQIRDNLIGGLSPSTAGRISTVLPGGNFPPEGAYPIDQIDDADIAPGASATVISIPVPAGVRFRLEGLGFAAYDPIAISFLTWSLLVGGDPFRAYVQQSAGVGNIRDCRDIVFFTRDETLVTVTLFNSAAAPSTYRFVVRARGWFYSETTG